MKPQLPCCVLLLAVGGSAFAATDAYLPILRSVKRAQAWAAAMATPARANDVEGVAELAAEAQSDMQEAFAALVQARTGRFIQREHKAELRCGSVLNDLTILSQPDIVLNIPNADLPQGVVEVATKLGACRKAIKALVGR
jgi:hypothetical protein